MTVSITCVCYWPFTGSSGPGGELWVEKHAPTIAEDLVVHKKKVGEVRAWLQAQAQPGRTPDLSRLLLITGEQQCTGHVGFSLFDDSLFDDGSEAWQSLCLPA